jgi:hypothetical protein
MKLAINTFIDNMQDGDFAAVVKFHEDDPGATVVQGFTEIDNATGGSGVAALHTAVNAAYVGGGSNVLDGTKLAVDQFAGATLPDGPKAVILVSDGQDNASTATQDSVIAAANDASVGIYTIGVAAPSAEGLALLQALADGTAGAYTDATDSTTIGNAYDEIRNRLNNQYLLTFPYTTCGSHSLTVEAAGQTSTSQDFTRCTDTTPPPPSGGGGGGGGGGAMGAHELTLIGATAFAGLRYRRRRVERVATDRLAA